MVCIAAAVVGGCGSSHSPEATADPARVVPASAPVYASAMVRPSGSLQANARADGQAFSHEANPYLRLLGALQTPGSPALDYRRDVAPWLGEQAAVFLMSYSPASERRLLALLRASLPGSGTATGYPFAGAGAPEGAIVLDTRDERRARSFLATQAARAGDHPASYRSLAYQSGRGVAFALVGHFAVIGSEAAMHAVIDTSAGGPALAAAGGFARLQARAPRQALARLYVDGGALAASAPSSAGRAPDLLALLSGGRRMTASLVPGHGALTLDFDSLAAGSAPAGLFGAEAEASRALGELPSESFFAIGFGQAAPALGRFAGALTLLGASGAGATGTSSAPAGISVRGLLAALLQPVSALTENSAQARRDFQSWMGSGGVFASGSGLIDLKAALVISSRNPALSRAAVAKLGDKLRAAGGSVSPASIAGTDAAISVRLPGLPVALDVADGRSAARQTKFAIALGEASVAAALSPSSSFSASATYSAASSALGEGIPPSLAVQVPTLLGLLEGVGLTEDPTVAPVLPSARPLGATYGGSRSLGGEVERFRLQIALRG